MKTEMSNIVNINGVIDMARFENKSPQGITKSIK